MNDLEMTKLCAEAMGFKLRRINTDDSWELAETKGEPWDIWSPLYNDAQAMALVKKLNLSITFTKALWWSVTNGAIPAEFSVDLNRAIVECVAKMQQSR